MILTFPTMLLAASAPLVIARLDVRLYLENSGTLSEPLTPQMALWNTIIGEGDAGEPSTSTLVDVVVEGKAGSYDPGWKVQLVVSNSRTGKTISRSRKNVSVLNKSGASHVAFWLTNTGCAPLKIVASVGNSSKETNVPFACGE